MEQSTGEAGKTYQYTAAQYALLTVEEREAIQRVANYLIGKDLGIPDDETLSSTFNILRPCDGCVPEDEISDDLLLDIRRKFACVSFSAVQIAEQELQRKGFKEWHDFSLCQVIDPSFEDTTHVALIDYHAGERPFCYFHEYHKAWHFCFETLKEIAEEVLRVRNQIVSTFLRVPRKIPDKDGTL